jgi:hypothetical protein
MRDMPSKFTAGELGEGTGLCLRSGSTPDFQPSLRDYSVCYTLPRISAVPNGTTRVARPYPGFHPGLLSAVPNGTTQFATPYPGFHPGLLSAVPNGTTQFVTPYPGFHPGLLSAVPAGLLSLLHPTQDFILGYFQPSLTGLLSLLHPTQDFILGYLQSSLRDWFLCLADWGDDACCGCFNDHAARNEKSNWDWCAMQLPLSPQPLLRKNAGAPLWSRA